MAPVYKIALIQLQPKPVAPEENFNRAAAYIRQAAAQGAHVALLPEYHLTSWVPEHPDFMAACAASGAYLARYQALARELGTISIVPGTICEVHPLVDAAAEAARAETAAAVEEAVPEVDVVVEGEGEGTEKKKKVVVKPDVEVRNMAYFIAAGTGEVLGRYQKKNLWHPERPHLTSSRHEPHTAFDTPLVWPATGRPVRAGLLVCWDLAFPEAFRELVADGADIIFIPSFWHLSDIDPVGRALNPDSERLFLESAVACRAFENTCAVAFCNAGGVSQVALPITGALPGRIDEEGAERVSVVDVDLDVLRVAEENYKVRADMKGEGWHYAYTLVREEEKRRS